MIFENVLVVSLKTQWPRMFSYKKYKLERGRFFKKKILPIFFKVDQFD